MSHPLVHQDCQEGGTCISWGPSVSSGPHLESPQDVGPSLCPSETAPHRPNLWLPEFTEEVGLVEGFLD